MADVVFTWGNLSLLPNPTNHQDHLGAAWLMSTERVNHTAETIKNHPLVAREVEKYEPIIVAAEKELPIATAHLGKAQAIHGEAILPEKVDVIAVPNEFNQAISRATAL